MVAFEMPVPCVMKRSSSALELGNGRGGESRQFSRLAAEVEANIDRGWQFNRLSEYCPVCWSMAAGSNNQKSRYPRASQSSVVALLEKRVWAKQTGIRGMSWPNPAVQVVTPGKLGAEIGRGLL